jgi:GT2 family glycosyltransferase
VGTPLVTIVVTTDDRTRDVNGREMRLLTNCLHSVVQKTAYPNYEVLVIDNGRLSDESACFLSTVPHRRVSYAYNGAFNFAHKLNFSVRHARGEHLVIFNDDLEVISSEWMSAMLEFSQQPEIGAVGAKLLFPDGRLQHIGMVLGVCGVAAHAFHTAPGSSSGYAGGAHVIRNYSSVTGACMMTRRAVFDEVGGFNERLAIDFNDVDYCLRLRHAGYRIVYTPYAKLYHLESGSHGGREQARTEKDEMCRTWSEVIERDPYYNPNLTRDFPDHRIGM